MNKFLHSLCVNILFFIISAADPVKLIPGEHSVIKKDGVTHSISKYYVVPADFDAKLTTNASGISEKTTITSGNQRYTKNMDGAENEDATEEKIDKYIVDFNPKAENNPQSSETEDLQQPKHEENKNSAITLVANHVNLDSEDIETDGRVGNSDDDLENSNSEKYLPGRDSNTGELNIWLNVPTPVPESDPKISIDQPINIQKSQLLVPSALAHERMLDPNEHHDPTISSNKKQIGREGTNDNDNLNLNIFDTAEINKLPWMAESNADFVSRTKPKSVKHRYWAGKGSQNAPWNIENQEVYHSPWVIDDRQFNNMPWTIGEIIKQNQLLNTVHQKGPLPIPSYPYNVADSSEKFLLGTQQSPLITAVKSSALTNQIGKPFIYTYVVTPAKVVYGPKIAKNSVEIKSDKYPNNNLQTLLKNTYGLSSTYGNDLGSKVTLINTQSPQYYKTRSSYYESPLKIETDIGLTKQDKEPFIEPETLVPQTPQDYYESTLKLNLNEDTEKRSTILSSNALTEILTKIADENTSGIGLQVEQLSGNAENLRPNIPSNPYGLGIETYSEVKIPTNQDIVDVKNWQTNYDSQADLHIEEDDSDDDKIDSEAEAPLQPDPQPLYNIEDDVEIDQKTNSNIDPSESEYEILETGYKLAPGYNPESAVRVKMSVPDQLYRYITPRISNQLSEYGYHTQDKQTLSPIYQLFSVENLIKLHNALFNVPQLGKLDVYQIQALANLKKINNILLGLAKHLGKGNQRWYEAIFNNVGDGNPLQVYVYNLLRQKWLHDIMLTLYKNNFNPRILNNPRLYSLLGAWRFPDFVLRFLENEYKHFHIYDLPGQHAEDNILKLLGEKPRPREILNDYVPDNIVDVLTISKDNVGLNANIIINILKHYLLSKQYLEHQENIINRGNKIEMFKQIVIFLKEKGYQGRTILELIKRLYSVLFTIEGKRCISKGPNDFVQTVYNVIVPVLRRSGA